MYHDSDDKAVCRGCGIELRGKPYWAGGSAYRLDNGKRALINHFGGYVCSETCDRRAYLDLESSMPGHGGQQKLDYQTSKRITEKWLTYD